MEDLTIKMRISQLGFRLSELMRAHARKDDYAVAAFTREYFPRLKTGMLEEKEWGKLGKISDAMQRLSAFVTYLDKHGLEMRSEGGVNLTSKLSESDLIDGLREKSSRLMFLNEMKRERDHDYGWAAKFIDKSGYDDDATPPLAKCIEKLYETIDQGVSQGKWR